MQQLNGREPNAPRMPRSTAWRRVTTLLLAALLTGSLAFAQEQGGSAVVSFQDDISTLDPQVGYDWQNWSIIKTIFDGLMDYVPGTTELVPQIGRAHV